MPEGLLFAMHEEVWYPDNSKWAQRQYPSHDNLVVGEVLIIALDGMLHAIS